MSTLQLANSIVIYDDAGVTNNPYLRLPDWTKNFTLSVSNPQANKYLVQAGTTLTVFNGSDATSIDGTSSFSIALNPALSSTYRVTWTGGTAPAFRTDRNLALNTGTMTVTINNNATATFTTSILNGFNAALVGDVLFIPGPVTGDAATPFNVLNQGFWKVLAKTTTSVTVSRFAGQLFSGIAETVTVTANSQVMAFSSTGVAINDKVEISAGFSAVTWGTYTVTQVTSQWFEFISTASLPLETGVLPTATGLVFYNTSKRIVHVETDQDAALRFNGDTGNNVRVSPIVAGDSNNMSVFDKIGPSWSLSIVNRSPVYAMNIVVITAE